MPPKDKKKDKEEAAEPDVKLDYIPSFTLEEHMLNSAESHIIANDALDMVFDKFLDELVVLKVESLKI